MTQTSTAIAPSVNFVANANLQQAEYQNLLEDFKFNPEEFWSKLAQENIYWQQEPQEIFSWQEKPFFRWFTGGKTNISYNCIDRHLEKHADKTAIIFEGEPGDTSKLSYQELHVAVCKAANMLKELGVSNGDHVCIYMPMCPKAIIAMHACMRIGAVHSVVFAGFSSQALRDRMEDLQAKYIITADGLNRRGKVVALLDAVLEASQGLDYVDKILNYQRIGSSLQTKSDSKVVDWQELYDQQSEDCPVEWLDAEDPSFVLYTSGSTGKPKGIRHTTAGYNLWTHLTCKWVFDLKESDTYWCTADIGWITGHSYVAYGPLSNAATIFIYEGAPNHPDESRFWSLIEKHNITIFYTAPTAIRAFMQWGLDHVTKHDLSSLRLLGTVGEPINPAAWHWFYDSIGKRQCPIVDTWWQTETGGIMITTLPGIHEMKPGAAGLPLPGIEADISQEGLLYLAKPSPSMARTIHGDDQRYIDTYWSKVPDAYTAGDAATKDSDGYIFISGRVDDVINVSGHRLGTAEIESALVAHKLISEAAVVSIPHEIKGEGIVAYVVLITGTASSDDLEDKFKDQVVSEIGAIAKPEKVIIASGLPKTRSGKIMRRLLKDLAQGQEPSGDISTLENKNVLEELTRRP